MSEAIIVAIITGGLSLIGVIVSNNRTAQSMDAKLDKQQAVTETKLEELTREVRTHNNFAQRVPVLEEQMKVANHRIADLEKERGEEYMATINNILGVIPAPVAAVLMLGGFIFYALGCVRLGYGAAVKPLVLDLIERAEQEIQGTKRGAERKAWVVKMLRAALSTSKYGRLISWAITDETIGRVIQFFFDRAKAVLRKEV